MVVWRNTLASKRGDGERERKKHTRRIAQYLDESCSDGSHSLALLEFCQYCKIISIHKHVGHVATRTFTLSTRNKKWKVCEPNFCLSQKIGDGNISQVGNLANFDNWYQFGKNISSVIYLFEYPKNVEKYLFFRQNQNKSEIFRNFTKDEN
ncbi:hypothetical protein BpHYR1_029592 [Brachionus plicatilis]|uniref:Uncharacterized protein n=1 Tax=Brachionus plicatilis TaxID=10195 RepID=A0A3M7SK80_BRAPC|nr:hypothetical protein BpHYR1_029592 [Brachionus plicatilis]